MMHSVLSAALVAALLALAAPASAATEGGDGLPPSTERGPGEVVKPDDRELSDFVNAFVRLMGVQHGYMMMMRDEQDPARLEAMKESAVADMTRAVEKDGMSVDRYNQIAMAVRDDPELQNRVEAILEQLAETPVEE